MTITEFNAWLEGFDEAIDTAPTEAQWKKVRDKLGKVMPNIVPTYIPMPYYTTPTWPVTRPPWPHDTQWTCSTANAGTICTTSAADATAVN